MIDWKLAAFLGFVAGCAFMYWFCEWGFPPPNRRGGR